MFKTGKLTVVSAAIALLASPALSQSDSGTWQLSPRGDLSAMLDCHEEAGKTLISAHRAGLRPVCLKMD